MHIHFVIVGMLFFWPVVGWTRAVAPEPWARLLYVAVALPFHAIVGLALVSSRTPLWRAHSLADQQAGGGVMMLGGDLITLAIIAIVFLAVDHRRRARRGEVRRAARRRRLSHRGVIERGQRRRGLSQSGLNRARPSVAGACVRRGLSRAGPASGGPASGGA